MAKRRKVLKALPVFPPTRMSLHLRVEMSCTSVKVHTHPTDPVLGRSGSLTHDSPSGGVTRARWAVIAVAPNDGWTYMPSLGILNLIRMILTSEQLRFGHVLKPWLVWEGKMH